MSLNLSVEEQLEKIKEANRVRAKRYYDSKKCKLSGKNNLSIIKHQREKLNNVMKGLDINVKHLGCSSKYFRDYIQSKMTDEMDLSDIHLDHIKPISSFSFEKEEDLINCCHYTNFQPLTVKNNLIKNGKWSEIDELFWNENIRNKEYLHLYIPISVR